MTARMRAQGSAGRIRFVHRFDATEDQLDFPVIYTNARDGMAT